MLTKSALPQFSFFLTGLGFKTKNLKHLFGKRQACEPFSVTAL